MYTAPNRSHETMWTFRVMYAWGSYDVDQTDISMAITKFIYSRRSQRDGGCFLKPQTVPSYRRHKAGVAVCAHSFDNFDSLAGGDRKTKIHGSVEQSLLISLNTRPCTTERTALFIVIVSKRFAVSQFVTQIVQT